MQFLISVISDGSEVDSSEEMNAIDAFNDSLREHGHWVYANGITSPEDATVIDNRKNVGLLSDGPLHRASEFIAGFWIITAPDVEKARELAFEGSRSCNRKVELRQLHGE